MMNDRAQDLAFQLQSLGSLLAANKTDDAIWLLKDVLETQPQNPIVLIQLGELLRHTPDIVSGVEFLRRGLAIQPSNLIGWLSLGSALRTLSQPDGAQAAFRRVLDLDPSRVEALNDLGTLLMEQSDWAEAALLFQRASELAPNITGIWINLARAFAQDGRSKEALNIAQTVAATYPNDRGAAQLISELTRPVTSSEMSQSLAGRHYNLRAIGSDDQMLVEPDLNSSKSVDKV